MLTVESCEVTSYSLFNSGSQSNKIEALQALVIIENEIEYFSPLIVFLVELGYFYRLVLDIIQLRPKSLKVF